MMITQTTPTPELVASAMTYEQYRILATELFEQGRTTSADAHYNTPEILGYTKMNLARMSRLDKQTVIHPQLTEAVQAVAGRWTWLVLTESWCGDAAQALPVLRAIAGESIPLRLLLRDENPALMDAFLTNGGRSIPKLICLDNASGEVLGSWGPRPAALQAAIVEWKAAGDLTFEHILENTQRWYNADRTESIQNELLTLVRRWSEVI
ncbi:thioredoxin family protein [Rudanella paleaurantiibacter]|uniref:Thioredoxin family protein n=2 Tax=Rudanella paleaurantiibacter TaxID=2614655 RepID=A0A7J5U3D8_9BACT|nr:thioredoxin family protein [Rudanella paleaurantiibacter]